MPRAISAKKYVNMTKGQTIYLNAPGNPVNGLPGIIEEIKAFPCGTLHYLIKWSTGGTSWLTKDMLNER